MINYSEGQNCPLPAIFIKCKLQIQKNKLMTEKKAQKIAAVNGNTLKVRTSKKIREGRTFSFKIKLSQC